METLYRELGMPLNHRVGWFALFVRKTPFVRGFFRWMAGDFQWARKLVGGCWRLRGVYRLKGHPISTYQLFPNISQPTQDYYNQTIYHFEGYTEDFLVEEFYL